MAEALKIPEKFTTTSQHSFTAIEGLALLCACFCSPGDLYNLSMIYDRAQSAITECINELVQYVDARWSHLLECDRGHLFHPPQLAAWELLCPLYIMPQRESALRLSRKEDSCCDSHSYLNWVTISSISHQKVTDVKFKLAEVSKYIGCEYSLVLTKNPEFADVCVH